MCSFKPPGVEYFLVQPGNGHTCDYALRLAMRRYVRRALVDLHVLLEVLLVVEPLPAVRLRAHEVAWPVDLVRAHVHVQVALPVEHSKRHRR